MAILNPPQEQAISEGETDDGTRYADDYYEKSVDKGNEEEYTERIADEIKPYIERAMTDG